MDEHSGCKPGSAPIISDNLHHLQMTFPTIPLYSDNAENTSSGTCQSTTSKVTQVIRTCDYVIESIKIKGIIDDPLNSLWLSSLDPTEQAFLQNMATNPPSGSHPSFGDSIKQLRDLSMSGANSLSTYKVIAPTHDLLYTFVANSCRYTPIISTNPDDMIKPLIDKIIPTIGITAKFGDGLISPVSLLEQEGTPTPGIPLSKTTELFHAGSGRITINLTDS